MVCVLLALLGPGPRPYLHMPSVDTLAHHDPSGVTVLPEGRLLTPAGAATPIARNPYGLALSPDGAQAFVASEGRGQWLDGWRETPAVTPQEAPGGNTGACAYSADGRLLYWANGEKGGVRIVDVASRKAVGEISLNGTIGGRTFKESYVNDLVASRDGRFLYCADVTNFRLAVLDLTRGGLVASVPTGRYPYAVALAGDRVFVANVGQFAYSPVGPIIHNRPSLRAPSPRKEPSPPAPSPPEGRGEYDPRGLTFPPFA